ncbi:MAG: metal-dependent hydrolase, partial [Candidatus Omnitrophica bacterium]|nr:metal-dependent hydrolase [Candidatus Omnitrophota bacterium]
MPLPVIHSFAGYAVHKVSKKSNSKWQWVRLSVFALVANLADFDFLPGLIQHQALLYHRGISHSLGAALLCGFAVAFLAITFMRTSFVRNFIWGSAAYFSHVVLDFFCGPQAPIPLFWPFTSARFSSPFSVFVTSSQSLEKVTSLKEFIYWFMSPRTMHVLYFEMAIVFSILTLE